MRKFKVIPVLDILNSEAVHGVKGERNNYKPLRSKLFNSSNPLEILKILTHKFQFDEFYIADLDAILNRKPNLALLTKILKIKGLDIIIDLGIVKSKDLHQFTKFNIKKLIIGLETVKNLEEVKNAISIMGVEKLIISIDMYKEKVFAQAKELKEMTPLEIVKNIQTIGIREIILLDLFRVGQKMGGIPQSYLDIKNTFNGEIFVGGGIKDYEDILKYIQHKFAGILIATALYDGTINIEKLRKIKD
ncbi:MAG: HisA/HisF-related TIM barrel protein [Candidatus Hermodarchaeota archaeon]